MIVECREARDPFVSKIIDGEDANIEEYPFLASLRAQNGLFIGETSIEGQHMCGGSLVAKNVVLTAAHCVNDVYFRKPTIYFNITKVDSPYFQAFNVLETRVHPKYEISLDGAYNYDAALLVLDGEPSVPIISIRYDDRCFAEGARCVNGVVVGWGQTQEGNLTSASNSLLKASIPLKSHKECRQLVEGGRITDAMVCAGGESKDSCQGDSGGPLLIDNKLAGIVSWGDGCGRSGVPGVYTNLAFLKKWLQKEFRDILGRVSKTIVAYLMDISQRLVKTPVL